MRNNLIINFECSRCGGLLKMSSIVGGRTQAGDGQPQPPTGATLLRAGTVRVEPCETCVEPIRRLGHQIADLLKFLTRDP